jgi:hypothetical protein
MAKNLLHCETGFGVYRSTQLGHIPLFLLLYLLVGPSIENIKCIPLIINDSNWENFITYKELRHHPDRVYEYFRMEPLTFDYILGKIQTKLVQQWKNCHKDPIYAEEKLVITIR